MKFVTAIAAPGRKIDVTADARAGDDHTQGPLPFFSLAGAILATAMQATPAAIDRRRPSA
jgi:hypothetical protein